MCLDKYDGDGDGQYYEIKDGLSSVVKCKSVTLCSFLGCYRMSTCCKNGKIRRLEFFGDIEKKMEKESHSAEKKIKKGDIIVLPGIASYAKRKNVHTSVPCANWYNMVV